MLIIAWAHQTPCAANRTFIQRAEAYLNLGPLGFLLMVSSCPLPASTIRTDPDDHSLLQPRVLASLPSDPSSFHARRDEPPYTPGCEYLLGTLAELQPGCAWRPHGFLSFAAPFDPTCVSTQIDQYLSLNLELPGWARLPVHPAPGIFLSEHPQRWSYKHTQSMGRWLSRETAYQAPAKPEFPPHMCS